jgi:hypothetical protein
VKRRTFVHALASLLVLAPALARAQSEVRPERLYVGSQTLLGSPRMVALGGAYAGIAEGADGFASNLASLAHRAPQLDRRWDIGFTFAWLDVPLTSSEPRDLDNDGRRDEARDSTQFLAGILLQYERFGLGTWLRNSAQSYCLAPSDPASCPPADRVWIRVQHTALAGAIALGREDFILGLGLYLAEATFEHHRQTWRYGGNGLELDALYRPHGLPYRVGLSVKPQVSGNYHPDEGQVPSIDGRPVYSAIVSPGLLSLGVAWKFGPGAENFNRLSPAARRNIEERLGPGSAPPALAPDAPTGSLLLSGQLDLVAPVEDATAVTALTTDSLFITPEQIGQSLLLVPRLGAEHETLPGRLRFRLGTFIEPSPFDRGSPRPHLTGGAELFLFHYLDSWAISASFDVARQYGNVILALGFWR